MLSAVPCRKAADSCPHFKDAVFCKMPPLSTEGDIEKGEGETASPINWSEQDRDGWCVLFGRDESENAKGVLVQEALLLP